MKKINLIIIAVLALVFLVSCVGNEIPGVTKPNEGASVSDTKERSDNSESTEKVKPYDFEKEATIEKQVLVDENGIKITALELDYSGSFGPKIMMQVENNTERDVMIQSRNSSVNGAMVESNFTFDIIAGESRREAIRFAKSDMELYGIEVVEKLEFGLLISDSRNWETIVSVDSLCVTTSAQQTKENHLEGYDTELYNVGGIKICLKKKAAPSTPVGTKLLLGIENKTEKALKIQTTNVILDGVSVSSAFSGVVLSDKTVIDEMAFSEWELSSLNVSGVKELSLKFVVSDPDTKETVLETEKLTVSLEP